MIRGGLIEGCATVRTRGSNWLAVMRERPRHDVGGDFCDPLHLDIGPPPSIGADFANDRLERSAFLAKREPFFDLDPMPARKLEDLTARINEP